jgi:AAA family ATP:ADP antiporter
MAGRVQTLVNLSAFLLQTFAVSRIFKYVGVRGALFFLPLIAFGGYAAIALLPIFAVVQWTKVLENSADYSVQNTTRHALFLPTSREAKYKAKQAIDSFFVRTGDMVSAGVVFAGTALAFTVRQYALMNVVVVFIWLAIAFAIAREHRRLAPADVRDKAA